MVDWKKIRHVNGTNTGGFEEFICQLAKKENINNSKPFLRKGDPDGGLEGYWELNNGSLIGLQAKYFIKALNNNQWNQVKESVTTACRSHKNLKKIIIAIPVNPSDVPVDKNGKEKETMLQKSKEQIKLYEKIGKDYNLNLEIEFWWGSDLISKLQNPDNQGFVKFWFDDLYFSDKWFEDKVDFALKSLGDKYTPNLIVESDFINFFNFMSRNQVFEEEFYNFTNEKIIELKSNLNGLNNNKKFFVDYYLKDKKKFLRK